MRNASSRSIRTAGERRSEVLPGHELLGDEADPFVFVDTVHRRDVGVIQRCQQLRLAVEPGHAFGVRCHSGGQDLDRHLAIEGRVHGPPHRTHPALADLVDDAIVQQGLTVSDGQNEIP